MYNMYVHIVQWLGSMVVWCYLLVPYLLSNWCYWCYWCTPGVGAHLVFNAGVATGTTGVTGAAAATPN